MDQRLIARHFAELGARVRFGVWDGLSGQVRSRLDGMLIHVPSDAQGEYFEIRINSVLVNLEVIDVQPQHLLLEARYLHQQRCQMFICGRERDSWFVAAVPDESVTTVDAALQLLRPPVPV